MVLMTLAHDHTQPSLRQRMRTKHWIYSKKMPFTRSIGRRWMSKNNQPSQN